MAVITCLVYGSRETHTRVRRPSRKGASAMSVKSGQTGQSSASPILGPTMQQHVARRTIHDTIRKMTIEIGYRYFEDDVC